MCFLPRGRSNLLARAKLGPLQPLCLVPTVLVLTTWRSMNRPMSAQSAVSSERELCVWIYYPRCPSVNASTPSNAARRNLGRKPTLTRRIFRCSGPGFPGSRLYSTTSRFPHSMTASKTSVFEQAASSPAVRRSRLPRVSTSGTARPGLSWKQTPFGSIVIPRFAWPSGFWPCCRAPSTRLHSPSRMSLVCLPLINAPWGTSRRRRNRKGTS